MGVERFPNVEAWASRFGVSQYVPVLFQNEFDTLLAVAELEMDDLMALGISKLGARKKFIAAVKALRGSLGILPALGEALPLEYSDVSASQSSGNEKTPKDTECSERALGTRSSTPSDSLQTPVSRANTIPVLELLNSTSATPTNTPQKEKGGIDFELPTLESKSDILQARDLLSELLAEVHPTGEAGEAEKRPRKNRKMQRQGKKATTGQREETNDRERELQLLLQRDRRELEQLHRELGVVKGLEKERREHLLNLREEKDELQKTVARLGVEKIKAVQKLKAHEDTNVVHVYDCATQTFVEDEDELYSFEPAISDECDLLEAEESDHFCLRPTLKLQHEEVQHQRDVVLERMAEENRVLEDIAKEAEILLNEQVEAEEAALREQGNIIKRRLLSSYEVAAHLGVGSKALVDSYRPYIKNYKKQLTPYQLTSVEEPESPSADGSTDPIGTPQTAPQARRKRRTGGMDPKRPIDYSTILRAQCEDHAALKQSTDMYNKMLDNYFETQLKMFQRVAQDPWVNPASDMQSKQEWEIKRKLGQLIGLQATSDEAREPELSDEVQRAIERVRRYKDSTRGGFVDLTSTKSAVKANPFMIV